MALTIEQEKLLQNITSDDIARWNAAGEVAHSHANIRDLNEVSASELGTTDNVTNGSSDNEFAVWDTNDGKYVPKTVVQVMELLGLKLGTNAERDAYTPSIDGFIWISTTDNSIYIWDTSLGEWR